MLDILLVTGGSGAGKTSLAEAWANRGPGLSAHVSHDTVHTFMKSGFVSPASSNSAEAQRQWRMAVEVCIAACHVYASHGVRCAIDTFLLPSTRSLWIGLESLKVGVVVLQPDVEVAVARNTQRIHETGWGVPEWHVRANHEAMSAWLDHHDICVIDNSTLDIYETLDVLDGWENRGTSSKLT